MGAHAAVGVEGHDPFGLFGIVGEAEAIGGSGVPDAVAHRV